MDNIFSDMETRCCVMCGCVFPIIFFYTVKKKHKKYHRHICISCYNKRRKEDPKRKENLKKWDANRRPSRIFYQKAYNLNRRGGTKHHKFTTKDIQKIWRLSEGKCYYCNKKLEQSNSKSWHVDHINPLSNGGINSPDNIVIACRQCNQEKYTKSESEFYMSKSGTPF